MGGFGSGRWGFYTAKQTVEDGLTLPISLFKEDLNRLTRGERVRLASIEWSRNKKVVSSIGLLIGGDIDTPTIRLIYSTTFADGSKRDSNYPVEIVRSTPNFGGVRWWWICPLMKNGRPCNRRVSKLYQPLGAAYFGCRHCYDLTYTSCQESRKYSSVYKHLAREMQGSGYPVDYKDVKRLLNEALGDNKRRPHR